MECAYKVVVGLRFAIKDAMVARSQHGIGGTYGDRPIEARLSLLQSLYPELQDDSLRDYAIIFQQQGTTTRDVYEFFYQIRMEESRARYMYVWRRNYEGSLRSFKIPTEEVTMDEYASSFVGHPKSIYSFVIERGSRGFNVPSIATIANILRGKSRPDIDQDMAALTEMVQTGLYRNGTTPIQRFLKGMTKCPERGGQKCQTGARLKELPKGFGRDDGRRHGIPES